MAAQKVKRKLTAILSADVKGYSRLMRENEEATVDTLKAYRETMSTFIQQHDGRVVDSPGDNVLAEFVSVVDAVACAVEIQKDLKARNVDLPENRRMEFRIGINLGDVIQDEDRIYGDGVNIAARVEGFAVPGGICISGTVYEHVKDKLALGYEPLGEHTVKNIAEPVQVYRVLMEPEAARKATGKKKPGLRRWQWMTLSAVLVVVAVVAIWYFLVRPSYPPIGPASLERMAYSLPDKPSIAVLAFDNLSGDPEQEYFSDGLTEEIITALSKVHEMFVIARNSTFAYKGKPVKVQQVGEELGVRYVLEGSVRKAGDRVRITAQLVDATTGGHLWSERYDRDLKDIFALQDGITMKILTALRVTLTDGEQARVYDRSTENLDSFLKVQRGMHHFLRFNEDGNVVARQMFEEAVPLDPENPVAYTMLGWTHVMDVWYGSSKSPGRSMERASELAQKALALDETQDYAHSLLGHIFLMIRQFEKAIVEGERAVALSPNGADAHAHLAFTLHYVGRREEAIVLLEKAMRLNPIPPDWYLVSLGDAYCLTGQYEEAIAVYTKVLHRNPEDIRTLIGLAATYSLMGREEEARAQAPQILRVVPRFSVESFANTLPFKNKADTDLYIDSLRKAGLK